MFERAIGDCKINEFWHNLLNRYMNFKKIVFQVLALIGPIVAS